MRVVRIFNTYGPRMLPNDGRVVSNFIVQALQGEDLTIYGDGSQTRSFCFVDDLIEAMMRTMEQDQTVGPVNIGNPVEFTIRELAEQVLGKIEGSSTIVEQDLPSDDPMQRKPDISLARKVLGWSPKIELSEGLDRTIPHFRQCLGCDFKFSNMNPLAPVQSLLQSFKGRQHRKCVKKCARGKPDQRTGKAVSKSFRRRASRQDGGVHGTLQEWRIIGGFVA